MDNRFTSQAQTAISLAGKTAVKCHHSYIGTEHLLLGLIEEGSGTAAQILRDHQVTSEKIMNMIDRLIAPASDGNILLHPEWTPRARRILKEAENEAASYGLSQAGTEHILLAMLAETDCVACRLLFTMGVKMQRMYAALLNVLGADEKDMNERARKIQDQKSGSATPLLEQYSRDLTRQAREGLLDPVIGRDREIDRIIQILSRRKKNNPCLIGEPGVGKTAVVEGLALRIAEGTVPESVRDRRLMVLDLSGMVAGTKYRGEFEERIKRVLREVMDDGRILLFLDELHTIIGAGGAEGALDASNILKPSLARGEIQLIGATTIDEYRKHIEKDAALERRFQPVAIDEPDAAHTLEILRELRPFYEKHHHVSIEDNALDAAVRLSTRYINDRFQPDKALDLIDEASSRVLMREYTEKATGTGKEAEIIRLRNEVEKAISEGNIETAASIRKEQLDLEKSLEAKKLRQEKRRSGKRVVTAEDVAATVSVWTGIPAERIAESESRRLARLEKTLHKRVIGQEEAVSSIARAVRRGRAGLKDPSRPIGSFLFLGPTGVGKTELCKALAEAVFGSEDAMIRVDMSEYMEKHSVSKLIGSPPGYVGYDEGGQLSEKIRRHPYSVLLFDEIEKAHPDVFNILLQVLDDGHITDAQGRKVSFKEAIIVMTSNAGASRIVQPKKLGFLSTDDEKVNYENMKAQVMDEISRVFRPEFLNRIDEIQVFHQLTKDDMRKIVDILLKDLTGRCRERMDITLRVTAAVKNELIGKSYDPKYGARPLKRAIQTRIEDPLAEELLNGNIKAGDTVVTALRGNEIVLQAKSERKS